MRKLILAAVVAASFPTIAFAQDKPVIEPYVGILAGGEIFDKRSDFGGGPNGGMHGSLLEAVGGVNIPLGDTFFVGGEGMVAKGINDIDWEYGAKGRAGLLTGSTGMIYLSAGREWVRGRRGFGKDDNWAYGAGFEASPAAFSPGDGRPGPRLRFEVDTYNFDSIRPMAGLIFPFR